MEKKEKYAEIIDLITKLAGIFLLIFLMIIHTLYNPVEYWIFIFPALMIGLDIKDFFRR